MLPDIEELAQQYYTPEMIQDKLYQKMQLMTLKHYQSSPELYVMFEKYPDYVKFVWKCKYPGREELKWTNFIVTGSSGNIHQHISIWQYTNFD